MDMKTSVWVLMETLNQIQRSSLVNKTLFKFFIIFGMIQGSDKSLLDQCFCPVPWFHRGHIYFLVTT